MCDGLDSAEWYYGRVGKRSPTAPDFTSQHQAMHHLFTSAGRYQLALNEVAQAPQLKKWFWKAGK